MNTLVLKPGQQRLAFNYFSNGWDQPVCTGHADDYRSLENSQNALEELKQKLAEASQVKRVSATPDVIAVRGVYGGAEFKEPTRVSAKVIHQIEKLVPNAPLHLPPLLVLLRACQASFKGVPIVLIFETAFFTGLPAREHLYAVDKELAKIPGLRRFGYHGVLHAAACSHVARQRREAGLNGSARILSVCLEPRPEVAAVLGQKPLMITSGATPLEGLPGQTTCGELDPSIVIMLAQKKGWGPEQINAVLTQQSGWLGLVGRTATLGEIFASHRAECELARQIIQYRLLQACGVGIAVLGGLDAIVFSGRCCGVGVGLGLWLKKKLDFHQSGSQNPVMIEIYPEPIDRVLAETACATVLTSVSARGVSSE